MPELSPREVEVLQCVAAGKSNKENGAKLFIAEGTVKTHITKLLEKSTLWAAPRQSGKPSAVA